MPSVVEDFAFSAFVAVAIVYYVAVWQVADADATRARVMRAIIQCLLLAIGAMVLTGDVLAVFKNGSHLAQSFVLFGITTSLGAII